jgi:hypothetical protein
MLLDTPARNVGTARSIDQEPPMSVTQGNNQGQNPVANNPNQAPQNQAPQNPVPQNPVPQNPVPQANQPPAQNVGNQPAPQWGAQPQQQAAGGLRMGARGPAPNRANNPAPVLPQNALPQANLPPIQNVGANNPVPQVQPANQANQPAQQWGARPRVQVGAVPRLQVGVPVQNNPVPQAPVVNNAPNVAPVLPQNAPVQPVVPVQPPVPQPPDMQGYQPKDLAAVDTVALKVRRWSVSTLTALGLSSRSSQDRVLASTIATAARVDESSCQPGIGPNCAAALKNQYTAMQLAADPTFSGLVNALETFENSSRYGQTKKARGSNEVAPLRQAATLYAQSVQGANPDPVKAGALAEVERVARAFELRDQIAGYGRPPWDTATAKEASKAKIELDISSMAAGSRVAQAPPGNIGGVNDKVWIKRTIGTGQRRGRARRSRATHRRHPRRKARRRAQHSRNA